MGMKSTDRWRRQQLTAVLMIGLLAVMTEPRAATVYQLDHAVSAVLVQPDQRIIVGGHGAHLYSVNEAAGTISRHRGGLFRLQSDGMLDESFQSRMSAVGYLKLHSDGRLFVQAGFNEPDRTYPGSFTFLQPDGQIDRDFLPFRNLSNGVPSLPLNWWPYASLYRVALERSGTVVLPPLRDPNLPTAPFARLDARGNLLPLPGGEFPNALRGGSGLALATPSDAEALARVFTSVPVALCRQVFELADGEFVLLGWHKGRTELLRFKSGWRWDDSFSTVLTLDQTPVADISVAQQPDGKLVVGGTFTKVNGVACSGLVRLQPTGALDPSFQCSLAGGPGWHGPKVALQKDGRVVIGGFFNRVNGESCRFLARLNSDGSLDRQFTDRFASTEENLGAKFAVVSLARATKVQSQASAVKSHPASETDSKTESAESIRIFSLDFESNRTAVIVFQGQVGRSYILQASERLNTPIWINVSTNTTASDGKGTLQDAEAYRWPNRFYRIATP
jgi:uncharacterized delta-60 repeat protein